MVERAASHSIGRCYSVRFEASRAKVSFVELDDQPFTNSKSEKSGRAPDTLPRAKLKSAIMKEQTIASILHSSESPS